MKMSRKAVKESNIKKVWDHSEKIIDRISKLFSVFEVQYKREEYIMEKDLNINSFYDALDVCFDKVYILSLVERKDRREQINLQLEAFSKPDKNFSDIVEYFYATKFPYNDLIARAITHSGKGRFSKANEYDCARNHYAMVKICYEMGCKHCLIMEDDILFLKDESVIVDYIESLPEDYDIAQFGGFTADPNIFRYIDTEEKWVKHKNVGVWNCSMYALSRKGMNFYLAFMEKMLWVADGPLYVAPVNDKLVNCYLSNIPIVIQADKKVVASDIRDESNDTIDYNNQNFYEKNINKSDYFGL